MAAPQDFHVSRVINRYTRILIGSLLFLVIVLSVSAGAAWSSGDSAPQKTIEAPP